MNKNIKLNRLHEFESNIFIDMLKISENTVKKLIKNKILPKEYSNLNPDQIITLYKDLLEATFQISKDFSYQYDNLKFKLSEISKNFICQICYDINMIKVDNKVILELDGFVVNLDVLKNINLENIKNFSFEYIINKIKDENKFFKINMKKIEDVII